MQADEERRRTRIDAMLLAAQAAISAGQPWAGMVEFGVGKEIHQTIAAAGDNWFTYVVEGFNRVEGKANTLKRTVEIVDAYTDFEITLTWNPPWQKG